VDWSNNIKEVPEGVSHAFEAVFQSVSDCVLVTDTSWRIMKANRRAFELFGYAEHELLGREADMLIPGAFAREDDSHVQNDLETGEPRVVGSRDRDVTARTRDGSLVAMGLTVNETIVDGRLVFISTLREIRNRKEPEQDGPAAAKQVAESEKMLRLVADSLPVLIAYFDTDLRYRFVNRTAARWYARDAGKILRRRVGEVLGEEMESEIQSYLQAAAQGHTVRFEKQMTYPDGVIRDAEIYYVPEIDADGNVKGFFGLVVDATERKQAEQELLLTRRRLELILDSAGEGIYGLDTQGRATFVNSAAARFTGWPAEDLLDRELHELIHHTRAGGSHYPAEECPIYAAMRDGVARRVEEEVFWARDGTSFPVEYVSTPMHDENGELAGAVVVFRDVSERKSTEAQLRHAQKMESIGQMTGGIAHDFNNLLGVVIGSLDMLERMVSGDEKKLERVHTAQKAALRGADLTKRLLAVARRQSLHPQSTDVNEVISELTKILPQTLGSDIEIETRLTEPLAAVMVDRSEFENVLLNLAINARDAMPDGGKLYFRTETANLCEEYVAVKSGDIEPGQYVRISVTDTGCGMSQETMDRAFEPFYSTKERGKSSGLGLSMVYGFIKQSRGNVRVYSEEGEGTTVNIYLPATDHAGNRESVPAPVAEANGRPGDEKILVVDDEVELLEIAVTYLEELGYTVYPATDADTALGLLEKNGDIALLLTDVIMPGGMNGVALAAAVRERVPGTRVLYTSGFPSDALADKSGVEVDSRIVVKPYRKEELARAVRDTLDNGVERDDVDR